MARPLPIPRRTQFRCHSGFLRLPRLATLWQKLPDPPRLRYSHPHVVRSARSPFSTESDDSMGAALSVWIIFSRFESLFMAAGVSIPEYSELTGSFTIRKLTVSLAGVDHVCRYYHHRL